MLSIEALKEYGANTEAGLVRCMGSEAFYLRMVGMILKDPAFDKLFAAVENGDVKEGFEAAHALKGSVGNLELTPILEPVCTLTEIFRAGNPADPALVEEVRTAFERLKSLVEE
jgi:HPt (histidine-containing phosphotransfer) domain-containing protein